MAVQATATWRMPADEYLDAMRTGVKIVNARGVACVNDKDGWLGRGRVMAAARGAGCACGSRSRWRRYRAARALAAQRSRLADAAHREPKAFMDGTLGSQTAWMLDGSGVRITSGDELAEIVRAGGRSRWPVGVHAIGDRANREALDAFEPTRDVWQPRGLRQRIEHAQCLSLEDLHVRQARCRVVRAVHARAFRRGAGEALLAGELDGAYSYRSLLRLGRAGRERLGRADRGARPVGRRRRRGAGPLARGSAADARAGAARDLRRAGLALPRRALARDAPPGPAADLVVLDRDPFEGDLDVQVVATMVAGRWVHNPPPWE